MRGQGWLDQNVLKVDQTRSCKVNLWGFISKERCGVYLVHNKFKSQHYKDMLEATFFPEIKEIKPDFIFMQDNASIHKAEHVMNYLKEENVELLKWPPRSPDLNPIENIWAEMQRLVNKHMLKRRVHTSKQLFTLCNECFKTACEKNVEKLYQSIPNRFIQVKENKGERTRY